MTGELCPDCGAEWSDKDSACPACGLTIEEIAETLAAFAQIRGNEPLVRRIAAIMEPR